MRSLTRDLWAKQDQHPGDRARLFRVVGTAVDAATVLYPGSYVDIAPSFVWPSVTYVDSDRRAAKFFDDTDGVHEILAGAGFRPSDRRVRFVHGDYTEDLGLAEGSYDLLLSLYAGFVSEHCTRYLRVGGSLLVNPSHGDAAMASIDDRLQLTAVLLSRSGDYSMSRADLDTYLLPKRSVEVTRESLRRSGRGIAYTRSPFAYLFQRVE